MKVCTYSYFQWCRYSKVPGCHLLQHNLIASLSIFNLYLTERNMAILAKPDDFESHNSLKLCFTYIWGLSLDFVEFESFLESNSADILALCKTNLDDSIDSGNFFVTGYLPVTWKDSPTHMHGPVVYVKNFLLHRTYLYIIWRFLLIFLTGFTSLCLISFSSFNHLLRLCAWFLILFHLTLMRFLDQPIC